MDYKSMILSKGFWGSVIVMLAGALGLSGMLNSDPTLATDTATWIVSLVSLVFGAIALWGRWTAKAPLALPPPPSLGRFLPALVAALALSVTLSACEMFRETVTPLIGEEKAATFERVTYQATIDALDGWETTQGLILVYVNWETCDPAVPERILCSKPKQVQKLKELNRLVSGELRKLRPLFEANPNDMDTMLKITSIVTDAYHVYYEIKKDKE